MGGELIRYNGDQHSLSKVSVARRTMDLALATLRDAAPTVIEAAREQPYQILPPRQSRTGSGAVLDMPRVCAVHDRLYVSRYVQSVDGFFHYGQGIRITSKSSDQYGPDMDDPGSFPSSDLDDEICPWCGASGLGAVLCLRCKADVCYGRTISDTVFHCRESCGHSGRITSQPRSIRGLRPQLGHRSTPCSGG
jgi:hypothetical protein